MILGAHPRHRNPKKDLQVAREFDTIPKRTAVGRSPEPAAGCLQGEGRVSRAFVKEPEGDQVVEELPEKVHSPHVNYVTPDGLQQLADRIAALRTRRQTLAGSTPAEDKKQVRLIDRDLRYWEERVRRAVLVDPAGQPEHEVHFGARVEVQTPEGRRMTFAIVGEDEADAPQGKISWVSPLAMALAEARVGDTVAWKRPAGEVALTVVAIRYLKPPARKDPELG